MSIHRTSVSLAQEDWEYLLKLAGDRWGYSPAAAAEALKRGERPGVSAVLRELIRRERLAAAKA